MATSKTAGYALITGASSGIGAALAEALAGRGQALILNGRDGARLEAIAARLRVRVPVETLAADLSDAAALDRLAATVAAKGWRVELLINNAGLGSGGRFSALPAERELGIVAVNVRAPVALTHFFLPRMLAQGGGAVINVASAAAFQPIPYMADYAASKAYLLHFSLALWRENRDRGVHVLAVCPGTTDTPFFERAGIDRDRRRKMLTPQAVARATLRGLDKRLPYVVCGPEYGMLVALERFLPRRLIIDLAARFVGREPG